MFPFIFDNVKTETLNRIYEYYGSGKITFIFVLISYLTKDEIPFTNIYFHMYI